MFRRVIDTHVHIGSSEKFSRNWSLKDYQAYMKKNRISYAVVMPNVSSKIKAPILNRELLGQHVLSPNGSSKNILLFFLIDPNDFRTANQVRYYRSMIRGLKYHPSVYQEPIHGTIMKPYLNLANDQKLPVLVHCGRDPMSSMSYVLKAAEEYPNVRFIAAHMGGLASDRIEVALKDTASSGLSNIWFDCSTVKLPSLIELGCDMVGPDRIFYGSDEPYSDVRLGIECVNLADIPKAYKRMILHENAKRFFGISS